MEELTGILGTPPLGVSAENFRRLGLILFVHVAHSGRVTRRRVAECWAADGQVSQGGQGCQGSQGGHRCMFRWDAKADVFQATAEPHDPAGLRPTRSLSSDFSMPGRPRSRPSAARPWPSTAAGIDRPRAVGLAPAGVGRSRRVILGTAAMPNRQTMRVFSGSQV